MGQCFGIDVQDKVNNGNKTKAYIFDSMKLTQLNISNYHHGKVVNVFSAKNNQLSQLPKGFFENVDKVIKFDMEKNEFERIDEVTMKYVEHLKSMNYGHNKILEIPRSIENMKVLKELNLSYNKIKVLPCELGKLISLETFDASHNEIQEIPEELIQLTVLSFLNLGHNKIKRIPGNHWKVSGLSKMDCSFNDIQYIPGDLFTYSKVSRLYLKGNQQMTIAILRNTPGFELYLQRRKSVKDQGFDHNLDMTFSLCGLD